MAHGPDRNRFRPGGPRSTALALLLDHTKHVRSKLPLKARSCRCKVEPSGLARAPAGGASGRRGAGRGFGRVQIAPCTIGARARSKDLEPPPVPAPNSGDGVVGDQKLPSSPLSFCNPKGGGLACCERGGAVGSGAGPRVEVLQPKHLGTSNQYGFRRGSLDAVWEGESQTRGKTNKGFSKNP